MQAIITMTTNQREQNENPRARALVRFNGSTFHSLAAASFLETAVPLQVNRLARLFDADPDVGIWLEQVWWPQRAELGRQLREYVEATWPEFDWDAAYREFREEYRPRSGLTGRDRGAALEALALCVTAAQAAVCYRTIAHRADEPVLRALARGAARDHAQYFDYFRALFERCKRRERVGVGATWRSAISTCRSARDHDVAAAFRPLARNWNGTPVVPDLGYSEYRARLAQLIQRHAALGPIERLLFRPWLERGRDAPVPQFAPESTGRWLQPASQAA